MAVFKTYRPYEPFQELLLAPNLQDWVPEGHLARFLSDVVDLLDLSMLYAVYEQGTGRGQPPYHPAMMLKLLMYGYCTGVRSSRGIERATYDSVPFRMLAGDQHPDHDSIADFRRRHLEAFKQLFVQTVKVAQAAGLADLRHVSVDGSKIKANASKHKAMSYDRMQEADRQLQDEIDALLAQAESADKEDDEKFGKGKRGDELPKELQRRHDRLKKLREAMKRLEEIARAGAAERAEQAKQKIAERRRFEESSGQKAPGREPQLPNPKEARPDSKAQSNFTDPDSRIMKDGATKEFTQAYNAQNAVDGTCGVIVGSHLTQAANDSEQLAPTIAEVKENCRADPEKVSADAGYCSDAALNDPRLRSIDLHVATGRERKASSAAETRHAATSARLASLVMALCVCCGGAIPGVSPLLGLFLPVTSLPAAITLQPGARHRRALRLVQVAVAVTHAATLGLASLIGSGAPTPAAPLLTARERMRRKLQSEAAKAVYRRRKAIAESPFGILKEVQGMRRFLLRGLPKVSGEWNLAVAGFNLLKLFRHGKQAALTALSQGKQVAVAG